MTATNHDRSGNDSIAERGEYEAPRLTTLGTIAELTASNEIGTASDHTFPGTHSRSGPGLSPGV